MPANNFFKYVSFLLQKYGLILKDVLNEISNIICAGSILLHELNTNMTVNTKQRVFFPKALIS